MNSPEAILADNAARRFSSRMRSTLRTPSSSTEPGSLPFEEEHAITEEQDPRCVAIEHGKQEEEEVVEVGLNPFMEICLAWKRGVDIERGGARKRATWEAMDDTNVVLRNKMEGERDK